MLFDENWIPLEGAALAAAIAAIADGSRLKIGTSLGERLMTADEESAVRGEWVANDADRAAAAQALQAEQTDRENAKQFARLQALRAMSPAQVSAYIATRYPAPAANLADANAILAKMRDDLETLAIGMAILARRL